MSNPDNKLDRLFSALRADSPEPREDELGAIAAREDRAEAGVSSSVTSTKSLKGKWIMITSISMIILTACSLYFLKPKTAGIEKSTVKNQNQNGSIPSMAKKEIPDEFRITNRRNGNRQDTMKLLTFSRSNIAGNMPYIADAAHLKSLGISKMPDGTVELINNQEYTIHFNSDTLPKEYERRRQDQSNKIAVPFELFPRFVTDTKGNLVAILQHKITNDGGHVTDEDFPVNDPVSISPMKYYREYSIAKKEIRLDSSLTPWIVSIEYKIRVGIMQLDTLISYPVHDDQEDRHITHYLLEYLTAKDSTFKAGYGGEEGLRKRFGITLSVNRNVLSDYSRHIFRGLDSVASTTDSTIDRIGAQMSYINDILWLPQYPDTVKLKFEQLNHTLDYQYYLLKHKQTEDELANINSLVPILIRKSTGDLPKAGYDNGLIFWYQPTKYLFDAVPSLRSDNTSAAVPMAPTVFDSVAVYPNPAPMNLYIDYSTHDPANVRIELRNLLGKSILPEIIQQHPDGGAFSATLDVSSLTPGMYILVLSGGNGEYAMRRIIVQRSH